MNANDLLHYMRGFFELVPDPSSTQLAAIRNEVLRATTVETPLAAWRGPAPGDCGCGKK